MGNFRPIRLAGFGIERRWQGLPDELSNGAIAMRIHRSGVPTALVFVDRTPSFDTGRLRARTDAHDAES
ncbi:MAG: hypothetical protein WDA25_10235 [Paracoccaceae bacterium]